MKPLWYIVRDYRFAALYGPEGEGGVREREVNTVFSFSSFFPSVGRENDAI